MAHFCITVYGSWWLCLGYILNFIAFVTVIYPLTSCIDDLWFSKVIHLVIHSLRDARIHSAFAWSWTYVWWL